MDSPIIMPCQRETSLFNTKHEYSMPKTIFGRFIMCIRELMEFIVFIPCPPLIPTIIRKFLFGSKRATYYFELKPDKTDIYDIKFSEGCEALVTEDKKLSKWLIKLDCYYINPAHTRSVDTFSDINLHYYMAWRLKSDVFTFDYSGYGQSTGKANEDNLCKDTTAAYVFLTQVLNVEPSRIIAYGQSLGTTAAMDLASKKVPIKGNAKVPLIECPTLVIHGALDPATYLRHAEYFFSLCKILVPPLITQTGRHLDLMNYRAYWNRLEIFFSKELGGGNMRYMHHCNPFCLEDHNKQNVKPNPVHDKLTWPFTPSSESVVSNISR